MQATRLNGATAQNSFCERVGQCVEWVDERLQQAGLVELRQKATTAGREAIAKVVDATGPWVARGAVIGAATGGALGTVYVVASTYYAYNITCAASNEFTATMQEAYEQQCFTKNHYTMKCVMILENLIHSASIITQAHLMATQASHLGAIAFGAITGGLSGGTMGAIMQTPRRIV